MLKTLVVVLIAYGGLILFVYLTQRSLIYFPFSSHLSPEKAGVPEMEVVSLQTEDGLTLKAWYRAPTKPHLPTLIYFHGNAGSIGHRGSIVKPFLNEGYGFLLVTYRGYSGNPGKPSERGLYQDGRAAIKFLQEKNVPLKCIVPYGESIGSSVAIQIASEYDVGGLILQSPFLSLTEIGHYHYPFFPVKMLLKDRFDVSTKVPNLHMPTLILYGKNDDIVPGMFSLQLYNLLPNHKHIEALDNTGHNDHFHPRFALDFLKKQVTINSCH